MKRFNNWLWRKISDVRYGVPDYSLKQGDLVMCSGSHLCGEIVDVNWALRAIAVQYPIGSILVLPAGSLTRLNRRESNRGE